MSGAMLLDSQAATTGYKRGFTTDMSVETWAGSGRYRNGPQNPHRIFIVRVSLLAQLVVVCWYVRSRTWGTRRGRGLMCQIDV